MRGCGLWMTRKVRNDLVMASISFSLIAQLLAESTDNPLCKGFSL
jgi:hypothetical protein